MTKDGKLDRRQFLYKSALSTGMLLLGFDSLHAGLAETTFSSGKFLGLVDFTDEGSAPVGVPIGDELDGRLYTDLTRLSARRPVTPTTEFFVRTRASQLLPGPGKWKLRLDGLVEEPSDVSIQTLRSAAKSMGLHLLECAGNVRLTHFGLISVASWTGVPIASILGLVKLRPEAARIVISGFDEYATATMTSVPGASWVFGLEELKAAGAFFATEMNGQPLTPDHGAPIRLVVPGWYGCSCIKWVNSVSFVNDEVEATSQMREYAVRTLQNGAPRFAKDFEPATIDSAAMPVRVEKWLVDGKLRYRIVGILWGGTQPVKALQIRFSPDEDFVPVKGFQQTQNDLWKIWTHPWSPKAPGVYSIRLEITDPPVRTRKLDLGLYVRSVNILEI